MTTWEVMKFLLQAGIAVLSAFLAAQLAARRFREDKWWDRKAAAYGELVDALHRMKWSPGEHFDVAVEQRVIDDEESSRLWQEFKEARRNVWRVADAAAFVVSPEILAAVQEMERELSKAATVRSSFEHYDEQVAAIGKCLATVKEIGRIELGIRHD
jgi:hypothetical protein